MWCAVTATTFVPTEFLYNNNNNACFGCIMKILIVFDIICTRCTDHSTAGLTTNWPGRRQRLASFALPIGRKSTSQYCVATFGSRRNCQFRGACTAIKLKVSQILRNNRLVFSLLFVRNIIIKFFIQTHKYDIHVILYIGNAATTTGRTSRCWIVFLSSTELGWHIKSSDSGTGHQM